MKNFLKAEIEYLKDNPEGYWFKRKRYGWGWQPAKIEGWITFLVYMIFIIVGSWYFETKIGVESNPKLFFLLFFGATILMISIAWKTGEPPKWQWGSDDRKDSEESEQ